MARPTTTDPVSALREGFAWVPWAHGADVVNFGGATVNPSGADVFSEVNRVDDVELPDSETALLLLMWEGVISLGGSGADATLNLKVTNGFSTSTVFTRTLAAAGTDNYGTSFTAGGIEVAPTGPVCPPFVPVRVYDLGFVAGTFVGETISVIVEAAEGASTTISSISSHRLYVATQDFPEAA